MRNYQESLTNLINHAKPHTNSQLFVQDIPNLQDLVDRNTPMKPINVEFNTHGGVMWGYCPRCNSLMVGNTGCANNECRQKIDWQINTPSKPKPKKTNFEAKKTNFEAKLYRQCLDDLKRLYGMAPYDGNTNYVRNDGYFAASINKQYPKEVIEECRKELKRK